MTADGVPGEAGTNSGGATASGTDRIGSKRWSRLIPVAILIYIIAYMDRTNISFAFDGLGQGRLAARRHKPSGELAAGHSPSGLEVERF